MNVTAEVPALLALDAGIRETGWALFKNGEVIENGVTGLSTRRKVEPKVRISHLIESLNVLTNPWQPQIVTLCRPSGINWPVPALDLLVSSLAGCSTERELPQFSYTRLGSTCGHRRASQRLPDQLGYATMLLLGLIVLGRSTHEWEAIAVGHYHQTRSN